MVVTHRAFQRVMRSWVNHPIQLYHLLWSRKIALELLWLISIYYSAFLCNNLSSNENQSKYFMLSNQQSAHQLASFSILSAKGKRRFQPRLQFSPLSLNNCECYAILRTRLLPWLHLLDVKNPT